MAVVRAVKGSHARPLSSAPRAIALGLALGAIGTFATVVGPGLVVAALVALVVMLAPQRAAVGGGVLLGFGLGWAYLIADAAARCESFARQPNAGCQMGDDRMQVGLVAVIVVLGGLLAGAALLRERRLRLR